MRHHKHTVRFGRQRSHYKATMQHLVSGLIRNKSISTTKTKARETSRLADRLVTLGKHNNVVNQRKAYSVLRERGLVSILFNEIAPLFKERKGGYTRVVLTGRRRGDNTQMAILEFVEKPKKEILPKKEEKKKPKVAKKEEKRPPEEKPKKEEVVKKEPPKKAAPAPGKPERPKEGKPKPGFFKRLFGRKKDK